MTEMETDQQWDEWLALFASRDEIAEEYAAIFAMFGPEWRLWSRLNAAILRRWSPAGLRYVKETAWKLGVSK